MTILAYLAGSAFAIVGIAVLLHRMGLSETSHVLNAEQASELLRTESGKALPRDIAIALDHSAAIAFPQQAAPELLLAIGNRWLHRSLEPPLIQHWEISGGECRLRFRDPTLPRAAIALRDADAARLGDVLTKLVKEHGR
ncbi:hypothetical protein WAB17_07670 [Parerythrobacter aurantius]|uniref:hypothetical protein n=1 Tax=Parerythrobacter aurantius TaxID=3127706 RepID=UPI003251C7FD